MFPWNLFPFNEQFISKMKNMKPQEIESFIQQMIREMIPKENQKMEWMFGQDENHHKENERLNYTVFQSHEDIYVSIPIVNKDDLESFKIYHTANELIISYGERKERIPLPSLVTRKGARAIYKDGILEIKIPRSVDKQISEINIRNDD